MTSQWHYFDTSVLVKLFFSERGSEEARRLWQKTEVLIATSPATFLEVHSALAKKRVRGELTENAWQTAVRHFEREMAVGLALGKVFLVPIDELLFAEAAGAIREAGSRWSRILTVIDSLHLAGVLRLQPMGAVFVSSDRTLCEVASLFGISVTEIGVRG